MEIFFWQLHHPMPLTTKLWPEALEEEEERAASDQISKLLFPILTLQPIKPLFTNILVNFLGQMWVKTFDGHETGNSPLTSDDGQLSFQGKTSLIRQLLKAQSFSHQSPFLNLSSGHEEWKNTLIFQIRKLMRRIIEKVNVQDAFYNEPSCAKTQTQRH